MVWPVGLPYPSADGYTTESQDVTIRTDMETGPARVRRRYTSGIDTTQLTWVLSESQVAQWITFYEDEWLQGAAWASIPMLSPRTASIGSYTARPTSQPKYTLVNDTTWKVALTVEVRYA